MAASNNSTRNDPRRAVLTPEGYRPVGGVAQRWDTRQQRLVAAQPVQTPNAILTPTGYVNVAKIKVPKFTVSEALDLSRYGYTGLFKAGSKETIGLKGAAWQQYQALQALRDKAKILPYQALETKTVAEAYKQGLAAKPITPGNKLFNDITTLNTYFTEKYGAQGEKYASRYGHLPTAGTKYGLLFDLNDPKIRTDAAMSMYQNDLASYARSKAKELTAGTYEDPVAQANAAQTASKLMAMGEKYRVKTSKWNKDKIGELEQALDIQTGGYQWSPKVVQAVGTNPPKADSAALGATAGVLFGGLGAVAGLVGGQSKVNELTNKVLTTMSEVSSSSLLAPTQVTGEDSPLSVAGILMGNTAKGLARMATGIPLGLYAVADSASKTVSNVAEGKWQGDHTWGGIDTTLLDAMKTDYTARYKTPFDKGVSNSDSWSGFGQKLAEDPTMPILDILSVVPVVGQIAKGASLASTFGKFGRIGEVGGVSAATAEKLAGAEQVVTAAAKPRPTTFEGMLKEQVSGVTRPTIPEVQAARDLIDNIQSAKVSLSARRYRSLARKAMAGQVDAANTLKRYERLGLIIPDGKNSITLRFAAKFEEGQKIMQAPRAIGDTETGPVVALKRLPASPIARGIGQGFEYIARTIDTKAAETMTATEGVMATETAAKIADILVRIPGVSYQWQYGRALKSAARNFWGDTASDVFRANALMRMQQDAKLTTEMEQAILSMVAGGEGDFAYNSPAIQRAAIERAREEAGAAATPKQLESWEAKLKALPEMDAYDLAKKKLTDHIHDPNKHADDAEVVAAKKIYDEMVHQQQRVHKIVSSDMNPLAFEHLKNMFSEALVGLGLHEKALWGDTGELTQYLDRLAVVNDNFHYHQFASAQGSDMVINEKFQNVFDLIKDPAMRSRRIADFHEAIKLLTEDGVFHDASGPSNVKGAPVLVVAKNQRGVTNGFVAVHRLKLDGAIENGIPTRKALYDNKNVLMLPKEIFKTDSAGKVVTLDEAAAKMTVEQGAFNAMGDIFPNAHFYSDKVSESGMMGTVHNYADLANEHVVATNALKEHTVRMHTMSQINYLKNRFERDIEPLIMANAELIPAGKLIGKNAKNYRILKSVRVFNNLTDAEAFARARGILPEFTDGAKKYQADPASVAMDTPFDLETGMGTIQRDGQTLFVVKGDIRDWAVYAQQESASRLKDHSMYQRIMYDNLENIAKNDDTFVLAVPKSIDNVVENIVRDANNHTSKLLSNPLVKGPTNVFKRLVLNMSPRFIGSNVIGGMAMMMMANPMAAGNILIKGLEATAKRSGTTYWKNLSKDLKVLQHHLAYEIEHNIYHNELSATALEAASFKGKLDKYGWNAGYTTVAAFEETIRKLVAKDYLESDAVFQSFMKGPEVKQYIKNGTDFRGRKRDDITPFEAATDLLLDPQSPHYNPHLKTRMRYTTNTISGNYHQFSPFEQFLRNMLMPFYAWQRHSLAFTWRLPIDHPITANALGHIGAYGYNQALESGLPDWMYQTVPMPNALKSALGLEGSDYRIDMNALSPFGTTGDMAMAGMNLMTGKETGNNILNFTNPYVNTAIQQAMGVDPFTGEKVYDRKGFVDRIWDTAKSTPGISITKGLLVDSVFDAYKQDGLANHYAAIQNADDILKNMSPDKTFGDWELSVPHKLTQIRPGTFKEAATRMLFPVKLYAPELERMQGIAQQNAIGAAILNGEQAGHTKTDAENAVNSVREWKNKRDYVTQVWLPYAQQSGTDPATIKLVLTKLADEKPKRMKDSVFNSILQSLGG